MLYWPRKWCCPCQLRALCHACLGLTDKGKLMPKWHYHILQFTSNCKSTIIHFMINRHISTYKQPKVDQNKLEYWTWMWTSYYISKLVWHTAMLWQGRRTIYPHCKAQCTPTAESKTPEWNQTKLMQKMADTNVSLNIPSCNLVPRNMLITTSYLTSALKVNTMYMKTADNKKTDLEKLVCEVSRCRLLLIQEYL